MAISWRSLRFGRLPRRMRLKLVASALLAVPIALLLVFAVGEMAGGDLSGAQHIAQAAPLLLLLAAAWRYPRATGLVLVGGGVVFCIVWLVLVFAEGDPAPRGTAILMWVGAGLVFFAPPVVAGWLMLKVSRHVG